MSDPPASASGPGAAVRRRGQRWAVAMVVLVSASLWWGIHPPRSDGAYRDRSASTLEMLHSQVVTARLWLEAVQDDRVLHATALVALEESETDASTQSSTYASWQPPSDAGERVRERVTALADEVVTTLGTVRIAARDGRWADATGGLPQLSDLEGRLARLEAAVDRSRPR